MIRAHRIYDMHQGAICAVRRKGVEYMDWLHAFSAGRLGMAEVAW